MQPNAGPLCPVDGILEHKGFHIDAGTYRSIKPFLHWHRGIEVMLIHSGVAQVQGGGWQRRLHSGELIMNFAHIDHGSSGHFDRTVFHFVPDLLAEEARNKVSRFLEAENCVHTSLSFGSAARLMWAARELPSLSKQSGSLPSVQALMGLIVAEIEVSLSQPRASAHSELLPMVINYMRTNISSEEKLGTLADRFNISTGHLHFVFKNNFGCSPRQYWLALKLDQACALLQGQQQIQDISVAVGFQSLRGFQRAFQRTYLMSPSEYRASIQAQRI